MPCTTIPVGKSTALYGDVECGKRKRADGANESTVAVTATDKDHEKIRGISDDCSVLRKSTERVEADVVRYYNHCNILQGISDIFQCNFKIIQLIRMSGVEKY